jgi:hypothetical protein
LSILLALHQEGLCCLYRISTKKQVAPEDNLSKINIKYLDSLVYQQQLSSNSQLLPNARVKAQAEILN